MLAHVASSWRARAGEGDISIDARGVQFRTPNRTNFEKTPIDARGPDAEHSNLFQTTCGPMMAKLHLQQPSHTSFNLFNCFLWRHPHCQDAEHFFRDFSAGKNEPIFRWKMPSTTRGSANGGKVALLKSAGFYLFFRYGKPLFLRGCRWAHRPGPVNSFCLEPFWQHQLQAIHVVRKSLLYTGVRPLSSPCGFRHFEVRGVVFFWALKCTMERRQTAGESMMSMTNIHVLAVPTNHLHRHLAKGQWKQFELRPPELTGSSCNGKTFEKID